MNIKTVFLAIVIFVSYLSLSRAATNAPIYMNKETHEVTEIVIFNNSSNLFYGSSSNLTGVAPLIVNVDTSSYNVTNELPQPSTYMIIYNKTNALNSLLLVYGVTTQTINGISLIKCYPNMTTTNWITEY